MCQGNGAAPGMGIGKREAVDACGAPKLPAKGRVGGIIVPSIELAGPTPAPAAEEAPVPGIGGGGMA